MSYFIKQIDKSATDNKELYFNAKLDSLNIQERYSSLWMDAKLGIYSNANLPNFAYTLSFYSDVVNIDNINLKFDQRKEMKKNNKFICYYDTYQFSININLTNWSKYNEYLLETNLRCNLIPIFDQNIVKQFSVSVTTETLQKFIYDINQQKIVFDFNYANCFEVIDDLINIDKINDNPQYYIHCNIEDNYGINPLNYLLSMYCNFYEIDVLASEMKLIMNYHNKINEQTIKISQQKLTKNNSYLKLDHYYEFNTYTNNFEIININGSGIFSNVELALFIQLELNIRVNQITRKLILNSNINFLKNSIDKFKYSIKSNELDKNFFWTYEVNNYEN